MVISWGKPTIHVAVTTTGNQATTGWITLPTPVQNSTTLNTTAGTTTEAKEEGGGLVDSRQEKSTFALEFELFVKKPTGNTTTADLPIADIDGVITDNYSLVLIPEDTNCIGIRMDKCSVAAEKSYSSEDGIKVKYTFTALIPTDDSGMCKLGVYTAPQNS